MFAVAILAIMAVRLLDVSATNEQRAREADLLYVGNAYREAIGVFTKTRLVLSNDIRKNWTTFCRIRGPRPCKDTCASSTATRSLVTPSGVWCAITMNALPACIRCRTSSLSRRVVLRKCRRALWTRRSTGTGVSSIRQSLLQEALNEAWHFSLKGLAVWLLTH